MGKLIRVSVLTLLLACSASAGIMTHDVYVTPPPPPPPQQQSSQEAQEPVADQETAETEEAITPLVIQIALDLFALL